MVGKTRLRHTPKNRRAETPKSRPERAVKPASGSPVAHTLKLQSLAGNRAVQRLIQRSAEDEHQSSDLFNVPGVKLPPSGGGRPLPDDLRADMEQSFGQSFGDVRVHEGGAAKSVGAVAYTQGTDIHFAPGRYKPDTSSGRALVGHELTHVVQQRAGVVASPQGAGAPVNASPELEDEAARAGELAADGHRVSVTGSGSGVQRAVEHPAQRQGDDPSVLSESLSEAEAEQEEEEDPAGEMDPAEAAEFLQDLPTEAVEEAVESITPEDLREEGLLTQELDDLEDQGAIESTTESAGAGPDQEEEAIQGAFEQPIQRSTQAPVQRRGGKDDEAPAGGMMVRRRPTSTETESEDEIEPMPPRLADLSELEAAVAKRRGGASPSARPAGDADQSEPFLVDALADRRKALAPDEELAEMEATAAAPADAPRRQGRGARAAAQIRRGATAVGRGYQAKKQKAKVKVDDLKVKRDLGEVEINEIPSAAGGVLSATKGGLEAGRKVVESGKEGFGLTGSSGSGGGLPGLEEGLTELGSDLTGSPDVEVPSTDYGLAMEYIGGIGGLMEAGANVGQFGAASRQVADEGGVDNVVEGRTRQAKAVAGGTKGAARAGASGTLIAGEAGALSAGSAASAATVLSQVGAGAQVAEGAVETLRGTAGAGVAQYRKGKLKKLAASKRAKQAELQDLSTEQLGRAQDIEGLPENERFQASYMGMQAGIDAEAAGDIATSADFGAKQQKKKRNRRLLQAGIGALKLTGGALLLALGVTNPIGWAITGAAGVITAGAAAKRWWFDRKTGKSGKSRKEEKKLERQQYAKMWAEDQEKYRDVLSAYGFPDDKIGNLEYKTIYKALQNRNWG